MFQAIEFIFTHFHTIEKFSHCMLSYNKSIKLLFKYILAPALAAWLFYSLYRQIRNQPHLHESWQLIKDAPTGQYALYFWLAFILVFVNWGAEAIKWRYLMKPLEYMSFGRAFKSVLSGVTLSINTPNRIGEYGGRMLYVGEGHKLKSISLSILGSISQLVITLILGSIGLYYLLYFLIPAEETIMGLSRFWIRVMLIITGFFTIGLLVFFFRMPWLIRLTERIPVAQKTLPYIRALTQFDIKLLLSLLLISLFRYIIFILQYLLLWKVTGVDIPMISGAWLIAILFLVMAIVPSFAIADLGIRGQFSVALAGLFSSNTIGIISTTFGIWILNLFIPALAGSIMILSVKFFKDNRT